MDGEWHTERLLARRPGGGDSIAYRELFLDPAISEWLRPAPLPAFNDLTVSAMLARDERHWAMHGFGPWALVDRASGSLVGRGGLQWTALNGASAVELPWTIDSEHWGRGLASEAATAAIEWAASLRLSEVVALILPRNAASRRVAEKAGLRLDGETIHADMPHLVYRLAL